MALLPYSVREGIAGFRRAGFAAAASTSAMAVALILVGAFAVLGYRANQVSDWLRQRVGEVEVFLDDVDDSVGQGVFVRAQMLDGVESAEYVSRARAAEIFRQEFGEGAEAFFDAPFLPASVKVRVTSRYANADSLRALADRVSQWNHVDEVVFNQSLLIRVQENLRLLTLIGIFVGLLVLLASVFLVANTIRLTIYARRLLIRTMKLVGATDAFIRRPFLVEGALQGALAGVLALLVLAGFYALVAKYAPQLTIERLAIIPAVSAGLIVSGILLGLVGSLLSIQRFIRRVSLH